jgi:hypothetical protein
VARLAETITGAAASARSPASVVIIVSSFPVILITYQPFFHSCLFGDFLHECIDLHWGIYSQNGITEYEKCQDRSRFRCFLDLAGNTVIRRITVNVPIRYLSISTRSRNNKMIIRAHCKKTYLGIPGIESHDVFSDDEKIHLVNKET